MFMSKKWTEKPINRSRFNEEIPKSEHKDFANLNDIHTLDELYNYIKNYDIDIKKQAKSTVISDGPLNASIMIIGEAPGKQEDEQALPFVGDSGLLVNQLLNENNIRREDVYITNVINWRPPNNRTPDEKEIQLMRPILYKHIELYKPKIILLLGSVALKALFENKYSITRIRGQLLEFQNIKTIATFHPSYILRQRSMMQYMQKDFQYLAELSKELEVSK